MTPGEHRPTMWGRIESNRDQIPTHTAEWARIESNRDQIPTRHAVEGGVS